MYYLTSPFTCVCLAQRTQVVDVVYTEANRGGFTLKLMKCQTGPWSGVSYGVAVFQVSREQAAIDTYYSRNIFGKLPKGILDQRDLTLEYNVSFFHHK